MWLSILLCLVVGAFAIFNIYGLVRDIVEKKKAKENNKNNKEN